MKLMIRFRRDMQGSYRASCPALPGCVATGKTKDEARRKIELGIRGYVASFHACIPYELKERDLAEMVS